MLLNVLYIIGGERASGAEIVIERLILNNGFNSHVFIAPGSFSTSLVNGNKPYRINVIEALKKLNRGASSSLVFYLKALRNYFTISRQVLKYIKQNNINVVHCNSIGQAAYLLPLNILSVALGLKVKWLWTDHDIKYYFSFDDFLSKVCSKYYDITFAVSEAVKAKYKENKKVVVLYNGLDCRVFKPDETARTAYRDKLKFEPIDIVIGCAGVMSRRKGQLDLIKAFNMLKQQHANIHLLLAGRFDGDELDYNERVKAVLQSPGVTHVGQLDDMVSFYNACDIVVSNSDLFGSEPLGTTIYEAMACKKIVVGSNTGGTSEIITDTVDGYLFEAENIEAMMAQLKAVINKLGNQQALQIAARKKVEDKFDINIMSAKYKDYINN